MNLNDRQQKALELLRADSRRDLYQTCHFIDYAITYTAGEKYTYLNKRDVDGLVAKGLITPKYPNDPKVQCWTLTPNGEVRGASRLAGEASSGEAATSPVVLGTNDGGTNG